MCGLRAVVYTFPLALRTALTLHMGIEQAYSALLCSHMQRIELQEFLSTMTMNWILCSTKCTCLGEYGVDHPQPAAAIFTCRPDEQWAHGLSIGLHGRSGQLLLHSGEPFLKPQLLT